MTATKPDPRRNPYRDDLAAEHLRGIVDAPLFVQAVRRQVRAPSLPLRQAPLPDAQLQTEALFGETFLVYEENEGWAWGQSERDSYVGYLSAAGLSREIAAPTHRVSAPRAHLYPRPDVKAPPLALLSLNAGLSVVGGEGRFLQLADGGFIAAAHSRPLGAPAPDFVSVAETLIGTPYLWGGRTSLGLDCSALVQLSLQAAGIEAPRDSDMQAAELGEALDEGEDLRRGDLVFWRGHVGIMTGGAQLLHANAFHMAAVLEPLAEARARIAGEGSEMVIVRRLPRLSAA